MCDYIFKKKASNRPAVAQNTSYLQTKNPDSLGIRVFQKKGDDILSHITAVPSAQAGLTTLFGMGRGEPRRNNHLKAVSFQFTVYSLQFFNS